MCSNKSWIQNKTNKKKFKALLFFAFKNKNTDFFANDNKTQYVGTSLNGIYIA